MSTYATGNGQRATISLPDGSTVVLNVASRLDVPSDYANGNHALRLTGEGLFTVAHHRGVPFTVTAGQTTTRVLGTSFVVRRYAQDTAVIVAVKDGKVAVGSAIATAQRMITVGANGIARVQDVDPARFTFANGVLTLGVRSLSDAIPELNRWYDADIRLADPAIGAQRIKGSFTAGSLADLADILTLTFDVRVVRDGNVLTLYPITK
jgi:ferric-dicitrate binding protein FerR (iron transport regulator)